MSASDGMVRELARHYAQRVEDLQSPDVRRRQAAVAVLRQDRDFIGKLAAAGHLAPDVARRATDAAGRSEAEIFSGWLDEQGGGDAA